MNEIRCAIYTRKSVDDGTLLTQDFSSLDGSMVDDYSFYYLF